MYMVENERQPSPLGDRRVNAARETAVSYAPLCTVYKCTCPSLPRCDRSGQSLAYCRAALFQELSVCLQRGNACMLVRRSPCSAWGCDWQDTLSHANFNLLFTSSVYGAGIYSQLWVPLIHNCG
jgi:hypothetical protein